MNLHAYVLNDPINFIDPSGLQCLGCGGDIVVIGPRNDPLPGSGSGGRFMLRMPTTTGTDGTAAQERACRQATISEWIGAAREVGSATSTLGDIGQVGGAALWVVAPEVGLPILRGAAAVSTVGEVIEGGANLADGLYNGNWGPLTSQVVGNLTGRGLARTFESLRSISRRGPNGRYRKSPLTRFREAINRAARAAGSAAGC
jgi:hypothetical protein